MGRPMSLSASRLERLAGNLVDVGGSSPPLAATPGQSGDASLDLFKSTGQSDDENIFLEGQLTAPGPAATGSGFANNSGSGGIPANTLDEPVKETILRDVRAV